MSGRVLAGLTVVIGCLAGGVVAAIGLGLFDPRPVGELRRADEPGKVAVSALGQNIVWLSEPMPAPYTVRLLGNEVSGETDVGYGLIVAQDEQALVVAVSPLGYISVWEASNDDTGWHRAVVHLPWQTWPHVRSDENEIWLDVVAGEGQIWINRELLWQGEIPISGGRAGIYLESHGEGATVTFPGWQLYGEP